MALYTYNKQQFNSDISVNNANTEFISTNHINISGGVINVFGPSTHTDNIYLSTDNTFSVGMKDPNTSYFGYGTNTGNANINVDANGNTNINGSGKLYVNTTGGMNITGGFTSLMYITTKILSFSPKVNSTPTLSDLINTRQGLIKFIGKISNGGLIQLYIIDSVTGLSQKKYGMGTYVNICCNARDTSQPSLQLYGMSRESGSAFFSQYKFYYYSDTLSNTWVWFTDYTTNNDFRTDNNVTYTIRIYSNNPSNFYPDATDGSAYLTSAKEITNGIYTLDNRIGINKTTPAVTMALDVSGNAYINGTTTVGNGFTVRYANDTLQALNVDPTSGILNVNNTLTLSNGLQVNYNNNTIQGFLVDGTTGNTTVNNSLSVSGNSTVSGNSIVTGNSSVSGNVGIGITPGYKLDVNGNLRISSDAFINGNSTLTGNVGIGTTPSTYKLNVNGNSNITGTLNVSGNSNVSGSLIVSNKITSGAGSGNGYYFNENPGGGGGDAAWIKYYPRSGESCTLEIGIANDGDDHIALISSGNVGIGTTAPGFKLDVQGDIYSSGWIRTTSGLYQQGGNWIINADGTGTFAKQSSLDATNTNISNNYVTNTTLSSYATTSSLDSYRKTSDNSFDGRIEAKATIYVRGGSTENPSEAGMIRSGKYAGNWSSGSFDDYDYHAARNEIIGIYSYNSIWTENYVIYSWNSAFSDRRIKNNIVDIDDTNALSILRQIKPKTYTYIDKYRRGYESVIGFIAQEIKEIIPKAVNIVKNYIPNFYTFCKLNKTDVSNNLIITSPIDLSWSALHDVSNNEFLDNSGNASSDISGNKFFKIKLFGINENYFELNVINIIDTKNILVDISGSNLIDSNGNIILEDKYFLYGQEVDDFHVLDKNAIFTVVTAAVQDIDRHQQEDAVKISVLESKNAELEGKNATLESTVETLQTKYSELEEKVTIQQEQITLLQQQLSALIAKVGL